MEGNASWKVNSFSASQEIPHIFWNPEVHYHVHQGLRQSPILDQKNPVHILPAYFFKIHFIIIFSC